MELISKRVDDTRRKSHDEILRCYLALVPVILLHF